MIQRLEPFLPQYESLLARYLLSDSDFAREATLLDVTELGKAVVVEDPSPDELRELHRRALATLDERWRGAVPGSAEGQAELRLQLGEAGPFGIAFMLPQDLVQLKRHELRWRREHGKLLALFEQTDDLIVVLDSRGAVESVNPAFTRATGWSMLEAVTGMAVVWNQALPKRATQQWRRELPRRDGGSFTVEWSISPINDHDGQLLSHVCIGRDVTRRQQVEDGLRENDKLRAIATLAGGIAHDFNNLLGSIIGLAELCELDAAANSRQARNLGRIRQAGNQAAALVRQMLDFSRQTPRSLQRVALGDLVRAAEPLLRSLVPRDMGLLLQVDEDGPVWVDGVQMDQVLLNVAGNAAQAMAGRGGNVQIVVDRAIPASVALGPSAGGYMRLRVIDTGVGIPAAVLPMIFDPFFTTKPVGQGTGLGLAAVHGIVSGHDGFIEVSSAPEFGTTFSIFLPLVEALVPAASSTVPALGQALT